MTPEEMQKTMEFILEQQAQITVKVDQIAEKFNGLTEKVDGIAEKVYALAENVYGIADKVDKLADAQLKYEARTGRLEESFIILVKLAQSTDERLGEFSWNDFNNKMNVLADAQIRTDENIKNLTSVVDRYFSEGRNQSGP